MGPYRVYSGQQPCVDQSPLPSREKEVGVPAREYPTTALIGAVSTAAPDVGKGGRKKNIERIKGKQERGGRKTRGYIHAG